MREDRFTGLRVVDGPTLQVTAVRGADHHRSRERAVRPVAHGRELVPDLHHRGPDVVEELDLDDGPQAAQRKPDPPPDDVRLRERSVVHALRAKLLLKAMRDLEDTTFAFDLAQRLLTRNVRYVLAEKEDAWITFHLLAQARVQEVDHGEQLVAGVLRLVLGIEVRGSRFHILRIQMAHRRAGVRLR